MDCKIKITQFNYNSPKCKRNEKLTIERIGNLSLVRGLKFCILRLICIFLVLLDIPNPVKAQNNLNGLAIHPDNPFFIFYNGRFIVSWANNLHGVNVSTLGKYKLTHYELEHRWFDGNAPCLDGNRFPSDGSIIFNDNYFSDLKSKISLAKNNGVCISIVLFSLTEFEGDRTAGSRFGQNPWNACLGGPIDIGSCPYQDSGGQSSGATRQFLTLENYDYNNPLTEQYATYSSSWPLARRVQYRTEEIIKKFVEELRNYDNWFFNMLWETNDNPSSDLTKKWAEWFSGFVHNLYPSRLVFTGEEDDAEYATSASTVDGSCHEGNLLGTDLNSSINKLNNLGNIANNKPKVIIGYDPFDANGTRRDKLYNTDPGAYSSEKNIKYMRSALLAGKGVHPGTPFHSAFYDMSETLSWIKALQDFLETVDSWHNEPGDEIKDSTLPRHDDFSFIDLPDGDGRKGWPRYNNGQIDNVPPFPPRGVKVMPN